VHGLIFVTVYAKLSRNFTVVVLIYIREILCTVTFYASIRRISCCI